MTEMRNVSLPAELCDRAEAKFSDRFGGIEQLIEFLLSELVHDEADTTDREEQQIVEQRLRDLGYL